ncbi:MAG: DUF3108 domain-containing protein [Myxococcota bacterium]|nr:DUF3108 domain-containing protein [Myxococcota bacterium]
MRLLLVVCSALALLACGSKGAPPGSPKGDPVTTLPIAPPVATPGERMAYKLTLKGVDLGTFSLVVGELVDLDGTQTVVVQAQAKSGGFASLVANIDDRFTSWVDVKTGRPRRFEVFEHADRKGKDKDHVVVDFAARSTEGIPVQYGLNDEPMKTLVQPVTQKDVWDYNAFLLAIRGWEGTQGSTTTLEVFRSRYVWRITITLGGKGNLVTDLGELPVLRFDATTIKVDRNGKPWAGQEERKFTLWVSDDNDRVPLKLDATSDYGEVSMDIVEYVPGTGARLRP